MRGIAIQSDGGFITISGLDNNETVSFYAIDGKNLGFSTAIKGTTFFTAKSGSVVIAKFGNESIKILALASNPLQAAAVGNVAVVSVAERYVLLS